MLGGVAVVDAAQIVETPDHQSRTGQKDDGERELRHHYRAAEPPHAWAADAAPGSFVEGLAVVAA